MSVSFSFSFSCAWNISLLISVLAARIFLVTSPSDLSHFSTVLCCVRCWSRYYWFYLHFGKQHINSFICSLKSFTCEYVYFSTVSRSNCVWSKQILCFTLERFERASEWVLRCDNHDSLLFDFYHTHTHSEYCSLCALLIMFRSIHSCFSQFYYEILRFALFLRSFFHAQSTFSRCANAFILFCICYRISTTTITTANKTIASIKWTV